jgi:hypothetical protein
LRVEGDFGPVYGIVNARGNDFGDARGRGVVNFYHAVQHAAPRFRDKMTQISEFAQKSFFFPAPL